jgi:maltose transport system permease protein
MKSKQENSLIFWIFLSPVLFAFLMVIAIPFVLGIFYSLTDWSASARVSDGLKFVGLSNFTDSLRDPTFLYSFILTFVYTILNMIAINLVAFVLALLVTSAIKGRNIYRVGFFLPNLIGGLVLGYVWQFIFNNAIPSVGESVGFLSWLADPENLVLRHRDSAIAALIGVGTWQYAGYIMMIYVAAIESVPAELHEAATIDGAGAVRRLWNVTLPMVAQAFTVTMFLTMVNSFKQFDVNVSLTNGGPSTMFMDQPIFGTELLALNIYNSAFVGLDLAEGQARAFIFFIVLVAIALVQVSINKRREIEL